MTILTVSSRPNIQMVIPDAAESMMGLIGGQRVNQTMNHLIEKYRNGLIDLNKQLANLDGDEEATPAQRARLEGRRQQARLDLAQALQTVGQAPATYDEAHDGD